MPKYVSEQRIYLDAESTEEAEEKLRAVERQFLNYPAEFMKSSNRPQELQEDGSLAPYDSPVKRSLADRPALLVGNALVPEDSITGIKVHPAAIEDTGNEADLDELTDPVAIDIYTTAGIAFFEHGSRALALIRELGLDDLLRELTQKREEGYDPS